MKENMSMSNLYLICGQPASGKSTIAKYYIDKHPQTKWVSRDAIRFSLLKDDDNYFDKEDETYRKFVGDICDNLLNGYHVIADQTNLTPSARNKLLKAIARKGGAYEHVYAIWVKTSLETSLKRNENRTGREYVSPCAITGMFNRMIPPSIEEGFDEVFVINEE